MTNSESIGGGFGPSYNFNTSRPTLQANVSIGSKSYGTSVDTTWPVALGVPVAFLSGLIYWTTAESDTERQPEEERTGRKRADESVCKEQELRGKAEESQRQEAEENLGRYDLLYLMLSDLFTKKSMC